MNIELMSLLIGRANYYNRLTKKSNGGETIMQDSTTAPYILWIRLAVACLDKLCYLELPAPSLAPEASNSKVAKLVKTG